MALIASASGLALGANWPIAYSAAAATKIAEMTVVSKNARTLLRGRRLPAVRLRCCDNAVLPWAERARHVAVRTGPLRAKAASHAEVSWGISPSITGQNRRNKEPTPLPHHVARSDGADQAFPKKKLGCGARKLCRRHHELAISIVTITARNHALPVTPTCRRRAPPPASDHPSRHPSAHPLNPWRRCDASFGPPR